MFCPYCGKEVVQNADVCLGCGRMISHISRPAHKDSNSIGWWWLGFFFPLVGLILWLVWNNDAPIKAKRSGVGALVGFISYLVFVFLVYFILIFLSISLGVMI